MNNFNPKDKRPNDQQPKMPKFNMNWLYISVLIFIAVIAFSGGGNLLGVQGVSQEATYTKFKEYVSKGYASRIIINNQEHELKMYVKPQALKAVFNQPAEKLGKDPYVKVNYGSVDKIEDFLLTAQKSGKLKDYDYERPNENTLLNLLYNFGPFLLLIFVWFFFMNRMNSGGAGGGVFNVGKSKAKLYEKAGEMGVTFKDVAGQEGAKQEVEEIVEFLKNPEKFTELGGKIPKGALLIGPPGTGKTLLAKAVAGEADVPFFSMSGSDFVEMFVGVGASRVRDVFRQAKEKAPCIIFIDEIDAVGRARSKSPATGGNDERENTLNALLTEMDGFGTNSGVIVLAATNRVDMLDKALLRAGRFDRQIHVDLPDLAERKAIFNVHLRPLKKDDTVDVDFLARHTPGFSGADIANVCNEAALTAARRDKKEIDRQDFLDAVDRIVGGLERKGSIMTPAEKRTTAYHEAGHATVGWLLPYSDPVFKVSLIPRGEALGLTWYLPDERKILSKSYLMDKMCALIGGRVAEEIINGEPATGALNDLERLTRMAYNMVQYYGMSEKVGEVSFYDSTGSRGYDLTKPYSEKTAELMDQEVKDLVKEIHDRTYRILTEHKEGFVKMAQILLEKEVIFAEDIEKIFGPKVKPAEDAEPAKAQATESDTQITEAGNE